MKKSLSFLLAILTFGFLVGSLSAQTVWDGTADISWYDADQTSFDITTPEQLAGVAQLVNSGATSFNGKTLHLQNNLWLNNTGDSTNNWVPIGGSATATSESSGSGNAFKGTFNGHGHTIYNLYCEKTNYFHAGLFGCVQNPCTIDSLVLLNPTVKSCGMMGALVGMSRSGGQIYIRYCLVVNANIVGTPSGTGPSAEHNNIGGILGANYPNSSGTYMENCGVTGSISGRYIGGIGGNAEYAYLTNCYFAGDLTPLNSNYGGMTSHGGNRTNCYSYTNILNSQSQSSASNHGTSVTQAEMQSDSMITLLGSAFKRDNGINNGYPVLSFMAGVDPVATEICIGDWVTLTAFGYDSYVWDNGATTESIDVSPTTTTTYTVTGTLNGVSATHTATVTVFPQALINASIAPASDGQVHGTVTPESATVACGSSDAVSLTVNPDNGWRVASIYVNGSQTYGESTYGAFPFAVTPDGPSTHVVVHLTNALTCTHVHNLTVSDIYATNATMAWTAHTTGELSEYHILVNNLTSGAVAEYTTTDLSYMLTGLPESSSYQVGVYTLCTDGYGSDTVTVNFTTPCIAPITVANNSYPTSTYTTEGNHFPMSNHYLNSFTEQIYLPSDFNNTSADFSGMSFQYNDGQVITRTLDIYMAHTADVEFVQNVWATPLDSYVHVYSGPVTFNNTGTDRWVDIAFDTNFYYNGYDNLLLIVNDVTGSSVSNSNAKFYTINTNVNRSQCEYNNDADANWSITNLPATGRLETQVDNIRLTACDMVSCIAPNTLVLGAVDAYTAEISWYNPNASQSCEIEYKADADADWTSTGSFNGSSYTLFGLDANTHYQARVRALCGNSGESPWSETVTFRTECESIWNLPYSQNFDTDTYGSGTEAYIYCWDRYTTDASKPVQLYPTSAAHTTPNAIRFYDGANVTNIAIMPKVDESISVNQLQVNFWVRSTSSSAPAIFELGVMTDKNNPTTFEVLDTIPTPYLSDNQYTLVEYPLANYMGYGQYIAFRVSNGNGGNNIRLDDVTLDYIPDCVHPVDLVVDAVASESVDIHWTEIGSASAWNVEYGPAGFTPGEGTVETAYDTSYTVFGLTPNMVYDLYVWADCGGLESTSISTSFRTECAPIVELPYTQDFDTDTYGSGTEAYIYCWDRYTTDASKPVQLYPTSAAHTTPNAIRFYDGANVTNIAIMPKVDESISVSQLQVTFWVRSTSSSAPAILELGVMTDKNDPTSFDVIDTIPTPYLSDNQYTLVEYPLANYSGVGQYIAFRVSNGNGGNNIRLDDVTLDYIPACPHPLHLVVDAVTSETATFHWTETGSASAWSVEYGLAGFTPGEGTVETATDTFLTLYGLNPNTGYDLYVRADCGGGEFSTSINTDFRTDCGPIVELPYTENFETGLYNTGVDNESDQQQYILCWNRFASDHSHNVYIPAGNSSYAHSGSHYLDFHWTSNCYNIAIAPALDQSFDVNQLMVNFWTCRTGSSGMLEVGVMTDPEADSTFVPVDTIDLSAMNTYAYAEQYVKFDQYQGDGKYIAFRVSNASSCGFYIDDVLIDYAPSCSPVNNLEISDITGTSAMVIWAPGFFGTVDSYTLEYAEGGTGTWTTVDNITGTSYLLGGLDFSTYYDIRVKPNCSDLSSGDWTTETFRTNCLVGGDLAIGEESATNTYLPSYSFYNYSYTQQLFLAEEMGQAKSLESVTFDLATYAANRTYKIYLMHTAATSVSSWIDASGAQLVFDAPQQLHAGLNTFQFSTPFMYNGSDNLLLIVMDMTGSYQSSPYNAWRSHSAFSNASRYVYQDGSAYSISSLPSASGTGTSSRDNVIFGSPCDTTTTCVPPHMHISAISSSGATVNWVPGYQESAWELEYRPLYDTNWVSVGLVTSMSEVLAGLTANTAYKVRMRSACDGGEYSLWAEIQFTTSCGAMTVTESTPWFEDFESYTGTSLICWESPVAYTSSSGSVYPKILLNYGEAAHSGGNTAEFKGVSNMLVLPEFTNDIHTLRMSFWATKFGSTTTAVVGVVTDWTDPSTFEVLGDAGVPGARGSSSGGNGNYMGPFDFNGIQAASGRIAILFSGTTGDAGWNMDDFTVEIIPNCPSPVKTSVTVTGITNNTAEVSWIDNDASHNSWTVFYKPASDFSNNWQTVVANQPSVTLTGLSSITQYQVYVITNCSVGDNVPDATQTVTFTTLPSCSAPSGLVASGILATTADLYWVAGSDETEWEIEYGVENFTLGTGTTVTATGGTPYYQLQNLMPNTKYDAYVRAVCSNMDHSEWSAKVNFRTACDAFPLPMMENFDSYADWAAPDCWKKFESPNISGYAYVYGTDHYSGSKSLKVGTSASGDYFGYIRLPLVDAPNLTGLQISFMAKRTTGSNRPLQVCVSQELGNIDNLTVVASIDTLNSTWKEVVVPFNSYTGTGMYIVIGVPANYNEACNYWVDDVVVDYADSSAIPVQPTVETNAATDIMTTTATLNGTVSNPDNVTLLSKGFEWKTTASGSFTPVVVTGATLTHNLTGLTPNTGYTFRAFVTTSAGTQYGNDLTFTTADNVVCDAPTGLDTTLVANEVISISWNANTNVNSWNVRYRPENGEWTFSTTSNNGYTIVGLTGSKTYEIQVQANCGNGNLSEWSTSLFVTTKNVGIESWLENSVTLFPNPAKDVVNVQCTMNNVQSVEVFDVYGKLVNTVGVCDTPVQTRINVSGLADGMYFVRVTTDRGVVTKSFVKK